MRDLTVAGSSSLQRTAATDEDDGGDSGDGGAAAPVVREEGDGVGAMRRSLGKSGAALVELGDGEDHRDDGDSALVSCNSGEGRTSSGTIL